MTSEPLTRALRRGEAIGILPDQDAGSGLGIFVPFFGEPANSMTLLSRLAAHTRAPVFIAYAERLPRSRGFHLHFVTARQLLEFREVDVNGRFGRQP